MSGPIRNLSRFLRAPLHKRQANRLIEQLHAEKPDLERLIERGRKLGTHGFYRVSTLQIPSEIRDLARAVERLQPRIILEIGTARGGTSLIWAYLARERVITCDIEGHGGFSELLSRFPPPGSACKLTVLTGDSHDPRFVKRVEAEFAGAQVDFLFIDGDHTEVGVEQDFENYRALVRPGGLIAFHDIAPAQPKPSNQVQHFWKRIRDQYKSQEILADPKQVGFGIGILHVPSAPQA